MQELAASFNVPPLIARLLLLRGFTSAHEISDFLYPDLGTLPSLN